MFGIITKDFVEETFVLLSDLGYLPEDHFDEEEFWKAASLTLSKTQDFEDARVCVRIIKRCSKKMDMIKKIFERKLDYWQSLVLGENDGSDFATYEDEEDCYGHYFVTNGIDGLKDIMFTSISFEGEWGVFDKKLNTYEIEFFKLKTFALSSDKIRLLDLDDNKVSDIVFNDNWSIFLRNNHTPFDLSLIDGYRLVILPKEYSYDNPSDAELDWDQVVGEILWSFMDENSSAGLVKLILYKEIGADDEENEKNICMLFAFCAAILILYKQHREHQNAIRASLMRI